MEASIQNTSPQFVLVLILPKKIHVKTPLNSIPIEANKSQPNRLNSPNPFCPKIKIT